MPEKMLQKMLRSLCDNGAIFHHPIGNELSEKPSNEIFVQPDYPQRGGFAEDIPGGQYFSPAPEGDHSYYPPERHGAHVEIIMLLSGYVDFFINDRWQVLDDSKVHILLRNTLHTERHYQQQNYSLCWLSCLPESLTLHRTTYSAENGYRQSACRVVISPPMTDQLWECGSQHRVNEPHYFSLLVQCLDIVLSGNLKEQFSSGKDYHESILSQIRKYLDEYYFRDVSLGELAQIAHCSEVHLNRTFAARYGITIHRYLIRRRLQKAISLLRKNTPPGEAAHLAGFNDQRYFSRVFRRHTGMTPSEFAAAGTAEK